MWSARNKSNVTHEIRIGSIAAQNITKKSAQQAVAKLCKLDFFFFHAGFAGT